MIPGRKDLIRIRFVTNEMENFLFLGTDTFAGVAVTEPFWVRFVNGDSVSEMGCQSVADVNPLFNHPARANRITSPPTSPPMCRAVAGAILAWIFLSYGTLEGMRNASPTDRTWWCGGVMATMGGARLRCMHMCDAVERHSTSITRMRVSASPG